MSTHPSLVDPMSTVTPHDREPVALSMSHDLIPHIAVSLPGLDYMHKQPLHNVWGGGWSTYGNAFHQAFVCILYQFFPIIINISNEEGLIEVAMETIHIHSNVH